MPKQSIPIWDLSLPIENHFRWKVDRSFVKRFDQGDQFQVTRIGWTVHSFTHIDSPRHIDPNGVTSSEIDLSQVVGDACVIDLTAVQPNEAISRDTLMAAGAHLRNDDIALLRTNWDIRESINDDAFWKRAPYLTADACQWLLEKGIKALGMDFPQDKPIRYLLDGETRPLSEFVSHDILLSQGVPLIEYLVNLQAIERDRVMLFALPLKIPDSDGCPARVIAMPKEDT